MYTFPYKVIMKMNFPYVHVHEDVITTTTFFTWPPLSMYCDEYKID